MAQFVFKDKDEYQKIVGITDEDRIKYSKWIWKQKVSDLVDGIDTPRIRKMTPNEVEALQTMPKDYTYIEKLYLNSKGIYNQNSGDYIRISVLGNGWTKDVIKHLMKNMKF